MNRQQRKTIGILIEKIKEVEADLTLIAEEEQDKVNNAPENLQYSEPYERMQDVADEIQAWADELLDTAEKLEQYI